MESSTININVVRLKDQQCARLSVSSDSTLKDLAIELEKAGLVENTSEFNSWFFLNKYNDDCYTISDDMISHLPIKNNGTLYVLESIVNGAGLTTNNVMEQEIERLRQENQSLKKAIDILSRNM